MAVSPSVYVVLDGQAEDLSEVRKRGPDVSKGTRRRKDDLLGATGLAWLGGPGSSWVGRMSRLTIAPRMRSRHAGRVTRGGLWYTTLH